ncbi:AzlC family ABC transporter permease [Demequina salsinemoris]|uniref:AzlC family ABC transporter permease n=1 Tax=Demequina salsinemoris TaxID=577470 RepID=UPI0007846330|nr:AzlC family ABC transporter permease [Demequina salsinemoris]
MTPPSPARRTVLGIAPQQRSDAWAGLKAIAPLMPGSVLFGMAFGALIRVAGIDPWVGSYASVSVVAGASQIAIVEAVRSNAPAVIAVLTALVINARFALYSAALAPVFASFPRRWKLGLAHLMTDQAAVISLEHADRYPDPVRRRWFIVGGALPFVIVWVMGSVAGIVLGPVIPDAWQIGFIVPLMFLAVLVPGLHDAPGVVAVAVSTLVVVLAKDLPWGLNVLAGALAGIAVGSFVPSRSRDDASGTAASDGRVPDDGLAHDAGAGE